MTRDVAEALLLRARAAETSKERAKYATSGLSQPRLETDTQALLLRQLYLSHLEQERYVEAAGLAEQMIELGTLGDVAFHDAARACLLLSDVPRATRHLRTATRSGPPSRRAFHLSCLGSLHLHHGDALRAVRALERAVRWATDERVLYEAQLALARSETGSPIDLAEPFERLAASRRRGGYADYVLGEMALRLGKRKYGRRKLLAFVERVEASSISIRVGLRAELVRAKDLLTGSSNPDPAP